MNRLTRRAFVSASVSVAAQHGKAARISSQGAEATGSYGIIASEPPGAVRAGARLFESGGNAFDAVAAACVATCMLQPHMVDLGGYVCAAVVREGRTGKIWSFDANSVAPARATERMFEVVLPRRAVSGINENEYNCSVKDDANVIGPLAAGVPGVMAGIGMLWEKWGRAKWPQILAPAQELLEGGFAFGDVAAAIESRQQAIRRFPPSFLHLMPAGRLPKPGDVWRRRGMETTLRRLAQAGWRDFYEGDLARGIAAYVGGIGGILTLDDLKRFQPRITPPYETTYRQARIHSAILANGGATVAQFLNMMECFDALPESDPRHWHRLTEILKLAWRDRLRYLADPAQARVPWERLLSKEHAAARVARLRQYPDAVDRLPAPAAAPSPGTANISAADSEGNLIACTISHGGSFGSCLTVPDTGITLGHGMCRFDPHPGLPNSPGPGKRPLNNVCPTIVSLPGRDIAVGQRGGRRIVSVVAQICQRFVDWNQTGIEALNAPRLHVEQQEPAEVTASLADESVERLRALGHEIRVMKAVGGHANACERLKDGRLRGASNVWAVGVS